MAECGICGRHTEASMRVKGAVIGCSCCYRAFNSLYVKEDLLHIDALTLAARNWLRFNRPFEPKPLEAR